MLGVLAVAATGVLVWAGRDHGTNCRVYGSGGTDPGPLVQPVFAFCFLGATLLTGMLLALSSRRRSAREADSARPAWPSTVVALVVAWCALVYLPIAGGWQAGVDTDLLVKAVMIPPVVLLVAVAALTAFLQYALFLPLITLAGLALTRHQADSGYRWAQVAVVYALLGC